MDIPDSVSQGVERAIRREGLGQRILAAHPVGGGCINHGARLEIDSGAALFLKWNERTPSELFVAEAAGLRALREACDLRVPEPVAHGDEGDSHGWLLMEYVAPGRPGPSYAATLGRGLAELHGSASGASFGWGHANWIGSLTQSNEVTESWADFWRDQRIAPQLALARAKGQLTDNLFDRAVACIQEALADVTAPELLHGDLWGGNAYAAGDGTPVLIDPAVYRGHGEVDLAMTELFGGFGRGFYHAYREAHPITPEYDAFRRDLYQLYYLLVHVNLFGASYAARSLEAARRVTEALG
jgi:fructosamine-3-kinase